MYDVIFLSLACAKIPFSFSTHMIDIKLKLEIVFPESFGGLVSFSTASNFVTELLDAFLILVTLYVTWGEGAYLVFCVFLNVLRFHHNVPELGTFLRFCAPYWLASS